MSLPFPFEKGMTYHLVQKCITGNLLLNPSLKVNKAVAYIVSETCAKYGIVLSSYCVLSNHYHFIVTDTERRLPEFLASLNSQIALCLNCLFERQGQFWTVEPIGKIRLIDEEAILEAIVYTIVNPVAAGLVSAVEEWPGLVSLPKNLAGGKLQAARPDWYFDKKRKPEYSEIILKLPPQLIGKFTEEEFRIEISRRVNERVEEIREQRKGEQKPFLGAKNVLRRNRNRSAKKKQPKKKFNPTFSCKDKNLRLKVIEELKRFRKNYRYAFERFRSGQRKVIFPYGTFKLERDAGVLCSDP